MSLATISLATKPADIASVRELFAEYLTILDVEYGNTIGCAQGQEDVHDFPNVYLALFLGHVDGVARAACGLKHISENDAELGKLYCQSAGRGQALGRRLTETAMVHAKSLGYTRLVLSTETVMKHAIALYVDMGFTRIEKYMSGQSGCSQFMGIKL